MDSPSEQLTSVPTFPRCVQARSMGKVRGRYPHQHTEETTMSLTDEDIITTPISATLAADPTDGDGTDGDGTDGDGTDGDGDGTDGGDTDGTDSPAS
jgi:hypothetical protein